MSRTAFDTYNTNNTNNLNEARHNIFRSAGWSLGIGLIFTLIILLIFYSIHQKVKTSQCALEAPIRSVSKLSSWGIAIYAIILIIYLIGIFGLFYAYKRTNITV